MTRAKFVATVTAMSIVVCVAAVSLYMPKVIQWYFEPPREMGVSCGSSIEWAFAKFQIAQLISIGVGLGAGLLLGFRFSRPKLNQSTK